MRVVLDTNILVSALLGGVLKIIVDEWKSGKFTLIVSEAIAREYLEIINRPKLRIAADEIAATTDYLLKTAKFVTPRKTITAIKADPTDNKFIEAALEGKAIYIVSGDSHLLDLKSFREIQIVSAQEFISILHA
jgi:putative PIN family toxin of toxin-antitoxin system